MLDFKLKFTGLEKEIFDLVISGKSITEEHALYLYEHGDLAFCAFLASERRRQLYGNEIYYNNNLHIEVSNVCVNKCKFCSFFRNKGDLGAWELTEDEILEIIGKKYDKGITEVHFTGGLNPDRTLLFYSKLFNKIKTNFSKLHIKAFTAVEIDFFSIIDGIDYKTVLQVLIDSGLDSLAGGGAEILKDEVRKIICPEKINSDTWIEIHQIAHNLGIKSNSTMLYGHIESYLDRIEHMQKLITLQNMTGGFNCFIPLKYKIHGNNLGINKEISFREELKNYAICRLYIDNIPHLKAYWPVSGIENALLALSFGADDVDGTINDSTKIYSMAGGVENPELSEENIKKMILECGFTPVERDSFYNKIIR